MQKNELGQQNVQKTDEVTVNEEEGQNKQIQQKQKSPFIKIVSENSSPTHSEALNSEKQPEQTKTQKWEKQANVQTSLQNISIQSPIKKNLIKGQVKIDQKPKKSKGKINQKVETFLKEKLQKEKLQQERLSNSKVHSESYMKSSIKSNHKVKKINKPFYEETFYITGMKQNYLLLLSDTNQVLEFPIGMFTTQSQSIQSQNRSQEDRNANDNFHLIKDIKIGQPIRIKLQLDFLRQQKDNMIFNSLQRTINEECSYGNEEPVQIRNKQISIKRNK